MIHATLQILLLWQRGSAGLQAGTGRGACSATGRARLLGQQMRLRAQLQVKRGAVLAVEQAAQAPDQAEEEHTLHGDGGARVAAAARRARASRLAKRAVQQRQQRADLAHHLVVQHRLQVQPAPRKRGPFRPSAHLPPPSRATQRKLT